MALAGLYRVTQDLEGNVITGVLGTVTLSGTSTLATMFADAAGTVPLPNPTTNSAQYGSFDLFLNAGTYDMQFIKAGYVFETQHNITLRDPAAGVNMITGTANRVLVAPVSGVGLVTLSTPQDIAPDSSVQFFHLGLGTPAHGFYQLDVIGQTRLVQAEIANLGVGRIPDINYVLVVSGGASYFTGNLGIGQVPNPSYALSVGTLPSYFTTAVTVAGQLSASNVAITGGSALGLGLGQFANLGVGRIPDVNYVLAVAGGGSHITGEVGIGVVPNPAYALSVGTLPSYFATAVTIATQASMTTALVNGTAQAQRFLAANTAGDNQVGFQGLMETAGGTNRWNLYFTGTADNFLSGRLGMGSVPLLPYQSTITFPKDTRHGLGLWATGSDSAPQAHIVFLNDAQGNVGAIVCTATTTAYTTSSDARLKHNITDLTGELARIQALRPVSFLWNADESPGVGFLAHEVAQVLDGVISGAADAVEEDGLIRPQQIDYAKLVPWLVGALKTVTARLQVVEDAVGI